MTSEIRANTLKNRVGLGTVSYTNTGIVVSGIVTANSFSGPYNGTDIVGTGITLTSTDAGSAAGPELKLFRNSASPADADYLGQLKFAGESDTGVERNYAKITGKILDASNGTEDGILEFAHIKGGSQTITGRWRSDSLQLLNDTNLSVAGDTTLTGDLDVDGHTNLDNVSIAGITTTTENIRIQGNNKYLTVGASNQIGVVHTGGEAFITNSSGHFTHRSDLHKWENYAGSSEYLRIDSSGQITNTGIATSFVTTNFAANFAKLDIRGTNIANSNHYILSYGEGHANDHEFHMVNTLGDLVFRTGSGSDTDRLRIDTSGRISNNSRVATDFGSPNLLISGTNSTFTLMGDGSTNNSSFTGIKFRVAGGSTGDYTKAGIFAQRQSGYNDLALIFALDTVADATSVSIADEIMRITSGGRVIIGATSTIGNSYSNNFTVSEASGNVGMQFAGNNSTSNYASIYFGDAGHRQKHFIETQLGTNGHFTIGTIGTGPIRFTNSSGQQARITTNLVEANSTFGIANVGGSIGGSGGTENWIGIKDSGGNFKFVVKTHSASSGNFGKVGINNTNPTHPLHIVNTSSTFNSASLIKGDNSTSGQGAYATFTNTADSKSAYFGVDGSGLFNVDAGAALVGTNGSEPIIFATNGNDIKVRILGGTDNCLQLDGGSKLSITDYAPNVSFSGSYAGLHHDNHGNTLLALNASLNYSGTSGTHQWKQNNAHPTIGSAGMFIGGNGSSNNTNITFFRNSQGNSAGQVFAQDSWKFQIGSALRQNFNLQYLQRGFFKTDTSNQNATNGPSLASGNAYAYGYQEAYSTSNGSWAYPYPDLVLGYHTGVSFGGHPNYNGCRFFTDHPSSSSTMIFSVGNGNNGVAVVNSLSKGGGSFRIAHPHPSKKYTHDLQHSFIEGPQCDNIYRGRVDLVGGSATVNIDTVSNMTDGTFVLLNRDIQCFTSNETGWTAVKGSVSGNTLTITAQDNSCTDTISWMVIGERQDDKIKSPQMEMTDSDGKLIVEPLTIEESHM